MHVTSITLRFASFCLLFFISIQSITDIANQNIESSLSLDSIEKNLSSSFYMKNILPYDLRYINTLLEHGNKTDQERSYYQSIFRLFINLFKKIPCVNAKSFDDCVSHIPALLKKQFESAFMQSILYQIQSKDFELVHRFQAAVNGLLFQSLSGRYDLFKKDPELFLNNISQTITSIAQEEIAIEQLRMACIRFLEIGLSKIAWNIEDFEGSWSSFKELSIHLARLVECNIIDDPSDLDDLYWSLLTRYMYFLEIYATAIPLFFYENLEKELIDQFPSLFLLEEQESFLETKKDYFMRAILECKAKSSAFQRGIIVG